MMNRRQLLSGLIAVTAPAIVPISSLMPIKVVKEFDAYEFATTTLDVYEVQGSVFFFRHREFLFLQANGTYKMLGRCPE